MRNFEEFLFHIYCSIDSLNARGTKENGSTVFTRNKTRLIYIYVSRTEKTRCKNYN